MLFVILIDYNIIRPIWLKMKHNNVKIRRSANLSPISLKKIEKDRLDQDSDFSEEKEKPFCIGDNKLDKLIDMFAHLIKKIDSSDLLQPNDQKNLNSAFT